MLYWIKYWYTYWRMKRVDRDRRERVLARLKAIGWNRYLVNGVVHLPEYEELLRERKLPAPGFNGPEGIRRS